MQRPHITIREILSWADAYFAHWGRWPTRVSGAVEGQIDLTWCGINIALCNANRGLPGGSSLAQLLAKHRGVRNRMRLPAFTIKELLKWIDAHRKRKGEWPTLYSGPIPESPGDTWECVDRALRNANRDLPGGDSLAQLLARHRKVRNIASLPRLTIKQILAWADAYHRRTGRWPTRDSGPIPEAPGETWYRVATALFNGSRRLRATTLARLLQRYRGVRNIKNLPPLRIKDVVRWADAHFARTGQWPTHLSGPVLDAPGETWGAINGTLQRGGRRQPGGSSLYRVLWKYRGVDRAARNATRVRSA